MWDSIQPTEEWLLGQLPPLLKVRCGAQQALVHTHEQR